jgi:hypothetical protein
MERLKLPGSESSDSRLDSPAVLKKPRQVIRMSKDNSESLHKWFGLFEQLIPELKIQVERKTAVTAHVALDPRYQKIWNLIKAQAEERGISAYDLLRFSLVEIYYSLSSMQKADLEGRQVQLASFELDSNGAAVDIQPIFVNLEDVFSMSEKWVATIGQSQKTVD